MTCLVEWNHIILLACHQNMITEHELVSIDTSVKFVQQINAELSECELLVSAHSV